MNRYARQIAFSGIGRAGQEKLKESRVVILGMGALGSSSANLLGRAGIGFLRLVDRDTVDLTNLQRQVLYTEEDAREDIPKAVAAARALSAINSEIKTEAVVDHVDDSNIKEILKGMDLLLDATDNLATRMVINRACHEAGIPWIYGGVLGAYGTTMNILPEDGAPCFRCLVEEETLGEEETCVSAGVLGMVTSYTAAIQCAETLKILTGSGDVRRTLLSYDLWTNEFEELAVSKDPDCPVCGRKAR